MSQGQAAEVGRKPPTPEPFRVVIPIAISVVVGIFVALGLEGDARDRLIRNDPRAVAYMFIGAMIGVALPLLGASIRGSRDQGMPSRKWRAVVGNTISLLGACILLLSSGYAVYRGADGLSERENPDLNLDPHLVTTKGRVRIDVTANAPAMKSSEKMLLRVAAVTDVGDRHLLKLCKSPSRPAQARVEARNTKGVGERAIRVLSWGVTGPTSSGSASSAATVEVPAAGRFRYACAYVKLFTEKAERDEVSVPSSILEKMRSSGAIG